MRYISPEGIKKLEGELKERKTVKRKEIVEWLEDAKSLGDLSENTEYSSAREAQSFNEGRILELENILKNTIVIKGKSKNNQTVQLGSKIEAELQNEKENEHQFFTIVGSHEANPLKGKISDESPLGRAFLNHQVGDIIEADTPKGKIKYKIISIN